MRNPASCTLRRSQCWMPYQRAYQNVRTIQSSSRFKNRERDKNHGNDNHEGKSRWWANIELENWSFHQESSEMHNVIRSQHNWPQALYWWNFHQQEISALLEIDIASWLGQNSISYYGMQSRSLAIWPEISLDYDALVSVKYTYYAELYIVQKDVQIFCMHNVLSADKGHRGFLLGLQNVQYIISKLIWCCY